MQVGMKEPEAVFREYCARRGMRFTPERLMILEEIYREDAHFDVDGLFLRIRRSNPGARLAKVSIYRAIPHLLRARLIRTVLTEDGHSCYEHTLGHPHHDHMQCMKCGRILEFRNEKIDELQGDVCRQHDFDLRWHMHVMGGYCSRCRERTTV